VVPPRTLTDALGLEHFEIPRCATCRDAHAEPPRTRTGAIAFIVNALVLGVLISAGAMLYLDAMDFVRAGWEWAAGLSGAALGVSLACACDELMRDWAKCRACRAAGARTPDDVLDYPPLSALLAPEAGRVVDPAA